ncbi:MAG: SUMF1/EgtB/PvdO family nonheme iron enzyme [Candidatus Cloacimonetes bacterium]|nr:SUMF1/EgtB/PvdO family nonheme iron enzyme [Candidatus Cloacimonadota bacterium]
MSGNVWEWVWDIWGSYPSGSQTNPTGADSGSSRVWRGGSWDDVTHNCTVSSRYFGVATATIQLIGFRLCRVSP